MNMFMYSSKREGEAYKTTVLSFVCIGLVLPHGIIPHHYIILTSLFHLLSNCLIL